MQDKIDSHVYKIINGSKDAYKLFLKEVEDGRLSDYPLFFHRMLHSESFESCDYYAVYDLCQFIIESISMSGEQKKLFIEILFKKLVSSAEKGHVAAQCGVIILKSVCHRLEIPKELLAAAKRKALSILSTKKSPPELLQWSRFFLGLHARYILNDKSNEVIEKYFGPAHTEMNAAVSHYWISNAEFRLEDCASDYMCLKNYIRRPHILVCMNILLAEKYMNLLEVTGFPNADKDGNGHFRHILYAFGSYNQARSDYICAILYIVRNEKRLALQYLDRADKNGHTTAGVKRKQIEDELKNDKAPEKTSEGVVTKPLVCGESKIDNNFLITTKNKVILELHNKLEKAEAQENTSRKVLEPSLMEKIFNTVETNNEITSLRMSDVDYDIKLVQLLEKLSKKTIKSVEIIRVKLTMLEYLKIFDFLLKNEHLEKLCLCDLYVDCDKKSKDAHYTMLANAIINFLSKVRHLKKLEVLRVLDRDDDVCKALVKMKENLALINTKITLDDTVVFDKDLLLLADLLNTSINHLDLLNRDPEYSEKAVRDFAEKLRGNTTLKHLGLERFVNSESSSGLIKASHTLFNILLSETHIQSLDLTDTIFYITGNAVIENICKNLKEKKYLKKLNLTDNMLNDRNLFKIAHVFDNESSLECLILNRNCFTHVGLEKLASILSTKQNNLVDLQVCDLVGEENDETDNVDLNVFYKALIKIIDNKYSKIEKLSFPVFCFNTDDEEDAFNDFLEALSKNEKITSLEISDNVTDEVLTALIDLLKINRNIIKIKYHYSDEVLSDELHNTIQNLLDENRKNRNERLALQRNNSNNNEDVIQNTTSRRICVERKKADIDTFVRLFSELNMDKYELKLKDPTLEIEFSQESQAHIVALAFNSSRKIAKVVDGKVCIENFRDIYESEITSLNILLQTYLNRVNVNSKSYPQFTLVHYLSDKRQLKIIEEGESLFIGLNDVLKMTGDQTAQLLNKIATIFANRGISIQVGISQIRVLNYKSIAEQKIFGLATEIQTTINEAYSAYKLQIVKSTYVKIQDKLPKQKLKGQKKAPTQTKEPRRKPSPEPVSVTKPPEVAATQTDSTNSAESNKVECIPYGNIFSSMPTIDRFRRLSEQLARQEDKSESPKFANRLMQMILKHHDKVLNIQTTDRLKAAYCKLYHSIRLSELLLNYMQQNYHASDLNKSYYGIRAILADRPDYFIPESNGNAILYLHDHPQSFLTISRQIIVDIFDEKSTFKVKLLTGYSNVVFYDQFFLTNEHPRKKTLDIPSNFITNPSTILTKMKAIISFVQNCFSDISEAHIDLCAAKGAIFMLGHFSRILRDYHNDFCKEVLEGQLVKNVYSVQFTAELNKLGLKLGDKTVGLLEYFSKLNEVQIQQLAAKATLQDCCLLFIEARNIMAHNQEESADAPGDIEEIPTLAITYLALFFIKNNKLDSFLDSALDNGILRDTGFDRIDVNVFR